MRSLMMAMMLAAAMLSGCGDDRGDDGNDGGVPTVEGDPCVKDADCKGVNVLCTYKIADGCSAKGHCAPIATPTCASFQTLCGCDGSEVRTGTCMYAVGYAGGPTTGAKICSSDGGI